LAGDFNLDLDLDKRRDLFTDDEYRDVETYNYVANRLVDAARGRGSTAEPDRRLDYIFAEREAFLVIDSGPWKGHRSGQMDHDPVVADLRLVPQ
jgi:endonuclease/exonuclease/phosphatase family metal-dependent hydrolase